MNRSTTAIGPPHLGQRHSGCGVGAVDVSDWFGGVAWRATRGEALWQQSGASSVEEAEVTEDATEAAIWGAGEVGSDARNSSCERVVRICRLWSAESRQRKVTWRFTKE